MTQSRQSPKTFISIENSHPNTLQELWLNVKSGAALLLIAVLAPLLSACEKWSWPPYEESVRDLFAEKKGLFEEIHQNMMADNLEEMSSAHARGRNYIRVGANPPRINEQLQAKYSELIEERSGLRYSLRGDEFIIDMSIPPTQGGDFFFEFVRSKSGASIPHCDEGKARLPNCGACYEDLDPNWYMYWRWFPQDLGPDWDGRIGDGLPTMEEIQEQNEKALNECLIAGSKEMGIELGSN